MRVPWSACRPVLPGEQHVGGSIADCVDRCVARHHAAQCARLDRIAPTRMPAVRCADASARICDANRHESAPPRRADPRQAHAEQCGGACSADFCTHVSASASVALAAGLTGWRSPVVHG
ncbi:hypothetical protein HZS92_04375 [Xanthomonas citri pv. citri]|nr:hypothetical protein HZS92_04375 [Xanthomonas citri pv. citri]QYF47059.1 hypothetical protein HZS93_04434 [Xanthomonas citri]